MSDWYYADYGQSIGPFNEEQIKDLIKNNKIKKETFLWREGFSDWTPLEKLSEFSSALEFKYEKKPRIEMPQDIKPGTETSFYIPKEENVVKQIIDWASGPAEEEGQCPTCGYFVGSLLTCPRCGARPGKRISIRLLKIGSIAGSIIGIILLWLAAYAKNPIQIKVGDIDERMNGALVKIVGRVTSYEENTENNTLRMQVDDGTGEILLNAYNKLAQFKKVLADNMPGIGDKVEVTGQINETQKFGVSMFVSIPERVKLLERFKLKDVDISDITEKDVSEIVRIKASIASYKKQTTRKGTVLHKYVLSDGTGSINMTIFGKEMDGLPQKTQKILLDKKNKLELVVKIGQYREELQVEIMDYNKIKVLGDAEEITEEAVKEKEEETITQEQEREIKKPKKIKNITKSDLKKICYIEAEVSKMDIKEKGKLITLDDGSGEIQVMFWKSLRDEIKGFNKIKEGAKISGNFKVDEYKGKLQLKLTDYENIKVE
ncbi:MAG: OB-fold nucleic acid binding domain-containing protein [Candidatus Hydrogenedentota bacterium]